MPSTVTIRVLVGILLLSPFARAADEADEPERFVRGQLRAGLSWDNVSAMETGVLKFGGAAGIYVFNGIELGFEQQFVVPPNVGAEGRSWGYVRAVPFRHWPVIPFVSVRAGYYYLPDSDAAALGAGLGAVVFIDHNFAFEATLFSQAVMNPRGPAQRQTELDWRVVIYY